MLTTNYTKEQKDFHILDFNYNGTIEFNFCITGDSLLGVNWQSLLNEGTILEFGDSYGSEVDNGVISIENKNGKLVFYLDGAKGGSNTIKIPLAECTEAIKNIKI